MSNLPMVVDPSARSSPSVRTSVRSDGPLADVQDHLQDPVRDPLLNSELAASAANWLVNQTVLLSEIQPRPIHTYKLAMTHAQLRSVQWLLLTGLPGAVLLIGLAVWLRRRN